MKPVEDRFTKVAKFTLRLTYRLAAIGEKRRGLRGEYALFSQALLERISQALQLDTANRGRLALLGGVRRRFESLTPRQREVNEKVVAGCANKVIAIDLGLSEPTGFDKNRGAIFGRRGLPRRSGAKRRTSGVRREH